MLAETVVRHPLIYSKLMYLNDLDGTFPRVISAVQIIWVASGWGMLLDRIVFPARP